MNEEVLVFGVEPSFSVEAESATRDEIVNVDVVTEVTFPGLQDAEHANVSPEEPVVHCQLALMR